MGGGKEWWRKKWDQREVTEGRDEWNVLEELWLPVSTAGCSRWARGWNMQIHFQEMRQSVEMFLQNYALFALLLPRAFWRYQYYRDCRSVTNLGGDLASVPQYSSPGGCKEGPQLIRLSVVKLDMKVITSSSVAVLRRRASLFLFRVCSLKSLICFGWYIFTHLFILSK